MRSFIVLLVLGALGACSDSPSPDLAAEKEPAPAAVQPPRPPQAPVTTPSWSRLSSGEGEALRLEEGGELVALLVCRADGSGLHAASDRLLPVPSEERFTVGVGDEAFTLVADLTSDRPQGVQASGAIPLDFLNRVEAGEPVAFNYGAQNLGSFPPIPSEDARAFAGACRDIAS